MGRRSFLLPMLDGVANLLLLRDRDHAAEILLQRARGLSIPGAGTDADNLAAALEALLLAYRTDAALSPFGLLAAQWDIDRFLANLQRMADEEARAPDILDEPVEAPVIVTGLPRSGTSFLHGLLAEDPA